MGYLLKQRVADLAALLDGIQGVDAPSHDPVLADAGFEVVAEAADALDFVHEPGAHGPGLDRRRRACGGNAVADPVPTRCPSCTRQPSDPPLPRPTSGDWPSV
jgi:hypothetical protein